MFIASEHEKIIYGIGSQCPIIHLYSLYTIGKYVLYPFHRKKSSSELEYWPILNGMALLYQWEIPSYVEKPHFTIFFSINNYVRVQESALLNLNS